MVGNDAMRCLLRSIRLDTGEIRHGADQRPEQVDIVVVMRALHHRGDALEPHAGIDRGMRQAVTTTRGLLILHEHEVPDLDETVAILIGRAGRPAEDVIAMIVEDLRTGTAGTGIAHAPEIVRSRDTDDPGIRQAGNLLPQVEGVIILGEHRDREPLLRQAELLRHQRPGMLDRDILEVVAEREVAEHLEEGVVARGVADIVEVIVLATGPHRHFCAVVARR